MQALFYAYAIVILYTAFTEPIQQNAVLISGFALKLEMKASEFTRRSLKIYSLDFFCLSQQKP